MKQKLLIIALLFSSFIIYSCCKDKVYDRTLTNLKYIFTSDTNSSFENKMFIRFEISQDFKLVSSNYLVNEARADAFPKPSSCGSNSLNNFQDPISEVSLTCDKNLTNATAGTDLKSISEYSFSYLSSTKLMIDIVNDLNSVKNFNESFDFFTYIPATNLDKSDFYTFTLKIKTVSGKEFVAVTKPIYWKK